MTTRDDHELLRHHGDVDAEPGLVDFAVNVRLDRPPAWLRSRLTEAIDRLGGYPSAADDHAARAAVARRHGRTVDEVLPLAGAAEGFSLLPATRPRLAAVVHPSFTEPELVLRNADIPVTRVLLSEADNYRLRPERVPDEADLVIVGNPTNPTSVSHPADHLRALVRPGRLVVVDEAFADAVPGEPESLASRSLPGLLVLRSLTKMWGLPGLRVGYALGQPDLLARLTTNRPHWPMSTLALEALRACSEPGAVAEATEAAATIAAHREELARELDALPGVRVWMPAMAPFLLVRVHNGPEVRSALRDRGIAVRRCDTFPGLDADHIRVAVREPRYNRILLDALREVSSTIAGVTV